MSRICEANRVIEANKFGGGYTVATLGYPSHLRHAVVVEDGTALIVARTSDGTKLWHAFPDSILDLENRDKFARMFSRAARKIDGGTAR